ncbi:membrane protein [Corynebacterium ulcerans]|uniref:hypothetical protein n=1 Tax=Corynebacterium ulcerans TaxID=65058 RepID=UPI00062845DD|nr:hypothetical protein [Corynebacterium ulcerans]KKO84787.1 membrane protein [Corynebacterium ulcerans]KKO86749.1 membrane protein [Corynebacterium ulcerans]KPJ23421.1 hypothetical protein AOT31_10600 [Corynebacterium ulcerans]BDV26898.1 hypothetical protein CULTSU28_21460 [Corynebacterium ulcerans]
MKNNRILSLTISALATASVFTASSLAATSPLVTAVASAQTHDAMPGNYMINKAEDSNDHISELKSLVSVAKMRHLYHAASGEQKYENYVGASPEVRRAHEESENACYLAKARVALAILKVEGDVEARTLDLSRVGIDLDESEKALPVLKKMEEKYRKEALFAESTNPDKSKISNTHKIATNGVDGLERVIKKLKAKEETYEFDAYSILDWNVQDRFIKKIKAEHHMGEAEDQLVASKVDKPEDIKKEEILKVARENQEKLLKKHGGSDIPTPKPQEKPETHKEKEDVKPAPEKPKADAEKPKAESDKPKVDTENKAPETKDQDKVPPAKSPQISWSPTTWPAWLKAIVSLGGVGLLAGLVHILLPFLPR